jgi:arginyl-tRNA synthetase
MTSLSQKLSDIVGDAFQAQGLDRSFGIVKVADRPDLAQFQCNGAMAAAKAAGKNPREVATAIVGALSQNSIFSKLDIAGPGFINITLSDNFIAGHLADTAKDDRAGAPDMGMGATALLDYGGPNIAKAMHVGHLRAAIIGDSVRRIMAFAGYKTLGDVHMGDWGTHMGMLIDDYIACGEEHIVLDADLNNPAQVETLMNDMAERYPRAAIAAKENPALMERAQAATVKLQNKEQPHYGLWEKIRAVSVIGMKANYDALGVSFDLWKGEADVHDYIAPMVDDLRAKGYAVESDGAWVVPVAQESDKKEVPPLILYKRDGAVMYGTTDMATLVERMKLYNPAKIVYVVDQRQSLHFEQVFRAARLGGIVPNDVELTHAGFGTMNGTDGKPFKTRAGGVMRLDDLISMAIEKARARMIDAHVGEGMDNAQKEDVAHKVAIAAIKFADLQNARHADYVFDLDRLTSFEGKTGPYLLYQAVRIKSLLAKAEYPPHLHLPPKLGGEEGRGGSLVLTDADRPLALILTELPDVVEAAVKNYAPHYLCDYAYRLAQAFSSFYGNCHILSEENNAVKQSRLFLCGQTYRQLELVLGLLGIDIPERM